MADWEKDLPPIARGRLLRIGELTREEKANIADSERMGSLLSQFHQGQIGPESLWKRLKDEARPSLLRETQMRLVNSLSFASTPGGPAKEERRDHCHRDPQGRPEHTCS